MPLQALSRNIGLFVLALGLPILFLEVRTEDYRCEHGECTVQWPIMPIGEPRDVYIGERNAFGGRPIKTIQEGIFVRKPIPAWIGAIGGLFTPLGIIGFLFVAVTRKR